MIDTELLISVVALVTVPVVVARVVGFGTESTSGGARPRLTDLATGPLLIGLVTARIFTLALDDPEALTSLRDVSVLRSGVDFWPGVLAGLALVVWDARRSHVRPVERIASMVPFALMAYAVFEATCFVRDGCFGPLSPIGLTAPGLTSTQFPVGWVIAAVVGATSIVLLRDQRTERRKLSSFEVVWVGVTIVALSRAVASFWLPHIGNGLTRAHRWSLMVAMLAAVSLRWIITRRRSAFVRAWSEPTRPGLVAGERVGPLWVRRSGEGPTVFLLLHGLGSTGAVWGAGVEDLADNGVLFIPDLLGWGGSLDASRQSFTLEDHMDALDVSLTAAGLGSHRLVLGGHSMGAMLALRYAQRHVGRVDGLVTWGAPIYLDINRRISRMGKMARLFVMDAKPAQLACRVMCANRGAASRMAVISRPDVPALVASTSVQHTWPSYRGSLRSLVIDNDWRAPLETIATAGISVEMIWGSEDEIGDPEEVEQFAENMASVRVVRVEGGSHHLPFVSTQSAVVGPILSATGHL